MQAIGINRDTWEVSFIEGEEAIKRARATGLEIHFWISTALKAIKARETEIQHILDRIALLRAELVVVKAAETRLAEIERERVEAHNKWLETRHKGVTK